MFGTDCQPASQSTSSINTWGLIAELHARNQQRPPDWNPRWMMTRCPMALATVNGSNACSVANIVLKGVQCGFSLIYTYTLHRGLDVQRP